MKTSGRVHGGKLVVNGVKRWCSGAGHAEQYLVDLRLSAPRGAAGIGAVVIDRDAPGLSFRPREQLMGFRGVPSADMNFDGYSEEFGIERLRRDADGWALAGGTQNIQRLRIAWEYLGVRFPQRAAGSSARAEHAS